MLNSILITLAFVILFFILHKFNIKSKNILRIILIVLALEIYVFNFNSFRLKFKHYEKKEFTTDNFIITDMEYNNELNTYTIKGKNPSIEIKDINTEIGTLKLNFQLINTNKIEYKLLYTDKTSKGYRLLPEKTMVNEIPRSKYIACYLSGQSNNIKICFMGEEDTKVELNSIETNVDIPFNFSFIRVFVLSITAILVYKMITGKTFNIPYATENTKQAYIISAIIIFFIFIIIWISFTTKTKNKIYNDYIDSIINGKISLQIEPSEELKNLENPYDATQRINVDYIWDAAYYNNSYYIYFGILPALILFVPIKLISGIYLPFRFGVLIFSIFTVINITKILIVLYKKWFKNVAFNFLILSIIGTLSGSLLFWINRRPLIYEVVLSAAIYFSTKGIYLMFKATEEKNVNYKYLFFSALCLALAVACRPNHLLVSLIFIPTFIELFIKSIKERKGTTKLLCSVAIPYLVIGILLMLYNYIRFDNIFEFGTSYQLTVNDMKDLKYRILTIPVGIITQLFKLPVTSNIFPYFIHQYDTISFFGYYYVEAFVCGLFILNPINFILIFLIGLKKKIKEKEAYNNICLFTCVALTITIANIVLAGTLQRYSADYAWILNIASYLTLFIIVSNIRGEEIKKYILKISIAITLFMLIINFIVGGVVSENNLLEQDYPNQYYNIRYNICFWE